MDELLNEPVQILRKEYCGFTLVEIVDKIVEQRFINFENKILNAINATSKTDETIQKLANSVNVIVRLIAGSLKMSKADLGKILMDSGALTENFPTNYEVPSTTTTHSTFSQTLPVYQNDISAITSKITNGPNNSRNTHSGPILNGIENVKINTLANTPEEGSQNDICCATTSKITNGPNNSCNTHSEPILNGIENVKINTLANTPEEGSQNDICCATTSKITNGPNNSCNTHSDPILNDIENVKINTLANTPEECSQNDIPAKTSKITNGPKKFCNTNCELILNDTENVENNTLANTPEEDSQNNYPASEITSSFIIVQPRITLDQFDSNYYDNIREILQNLAIHNARKRKKRLHKISSLNKLRKQDSENNGSTK